MLLLSIAQMGVSHVLGTVAAWLYWIGESAWGTFMLAWMIVAGTMDNLLRPVLIRKGADLPLLLVFAGVVGWSCRFRFHRHFCRPGHPGCCRQATHCVDRGRYTIGGHR